MRWSLDGPVDWAAALASGAALAGAAVMWPAAAGVVCTGTDTAATVCHNLPVTAVLAPPLAAIAIAATIAFCLLPYVLRATPAVPLAWGIALFAFYVLSFGMDLYGMPAALLAIVAGVMALGRPRPEGPVHPSPRL